MRRDEEGFTIENVRAIRGTDRALLVQADFFETQGNDEGQRWIPKSQIHDDSEVYEVDHEGKLVVKKWLAEKEGWE
jgi:hypothetical protein